MYEGRTIHDTFNGGFFPILVYKGMTFLGHIYYVRFSAIHMYEGRTPQHTFLKGRSSPIHMFMKGGPSKTHLRVRALQETFKGAFPNTNL